jgi:hypothetical protein
MLYGDGSHLSPVRKGSEFDSQVELVNWKKFLVISWIVIIGVMLTVAGELDDAPGLILIALVTTPTFVALTYKA